MNKECTSIRLKRIMKERNLRQVDILESTKRYCDLYNVKMNKSDISQYVSGKVEPNQSKLAILGMALNVNEAWLMGYDVPMERQRNVLTLDTNIDDTPYNRALQKLQNKEELSEDELLALKNEFPKAIKATSKAFESFFDTIDDINKKQLIDSYELLNSAGKVEAVKRVKELTYIPNYQKTPEYLPPVAAHNDYADDDEEQRLMQEDLDDL